MAEHEYRTDLVLWAQDQARALRDAAGIAPNLPVDWGNVAEQIETLGKSQSRELASRISTVLIHLLKLKVSRAAEPRAVWRETIREQRDGIRRVLADAQSLRRTIPIVIQENSPRHGNGCGRACRLRRATEHRSRRGQLHRGSGD
jgi:hypothetical protein